MSPIYNITQYFWFFIKGQNFIYEICTLFSATRTFEFSPQNHPKNSILQLHRAFFGMVKYAKNKIFGIVCCTENFQNSKLFQKKKNLKIQKKKVELPGLELTAGGVFRSCQKSDVIPLHHEAQTLVQCLITKYKLSMQQYMTFLSIQDTQNVPRYFSQLKKRVLISKSNVHQQVTLPKTFCYCFYSFLTRLKNVDFNVFH